jgi:hypothetical protein
VQIQLERLIGDVAHQATAPVDEVADHVEPPPVLGVPRAQADAAVRARERPVTADIERAADDHAAAPAVVIGLPPADPHRGPLRLDGLRRDDPVHRVIKDGELRIIHILHRREAGQALRILDVEGLSRVPPAALASPPPVPGIAFASDLHQAVGPRHS